MRTPTLALLGLLTATPSFAQTGALVTEEAETAESGRFFLETGGEVMTDEPSPLTGAKRTRWDGPLLRLTASPAGNVEIDVEWMALVGTSAEPYRGARTAPGDVTLRSKVRLLRRGQLTLATRFGVILPQTPYNDELFRPLGLGPNTMRAFVEALATRTIGGAKLHANLGLFLHDEVYRPHEQRDFVSFGIALVHPLSRRTSLLACWAGRAGKGARGAPEQGEARAGVRLLRGRWQVDVAARRGLVAAEGSWGGIVALRYGAKRRGEATREKLAAQVR